MVGVDTSATPSSTDSPQLSSGAELRVVTSHDAGDFSIPDVEALGKISAVSGTLAQEMMRVTYERLEGSTLVEASSLLAAAGSQLAAMERLSTGDRRIRRGLDGARTALLTAARELREHLIRHGWVVDDVEQWQAAAAEVRSAGSAAAKGPAVP